MNRNDSNDDEKPSKNKKGNQLRTKLKINLIWKLKPVLMSKPIEKINLRVYHKNKILLIQITMGIYLILIVAHVKKVVNKKNYLMRNRERKLFSIINVPCAHVNNSKSNKMHVARFASVKNVMSIRTIVIHVKLDVPFVRDE